MSSQQQEVNNTIRSAITHLQEKKEAMDRNMQEIQQGRQDMAHQWIRCLYAKEPTSLYIVCPKSVQSVWSDRLSQFDVKHQFIEVEKQDQRSDSDDQQDE